MFIQGGLDPNKISDLGADFGIIVRSLLELNKSGALKPSLIMRCCGLRSAVGECVTVDV